MVPPIQRQRDVAANGPGSHLAHAGHANADAACSGARLRTICQTAKGAATTDMPTVPRGVQQGSFYRDGEASTSTSNDDDDDDEFDLDEGDEPDAATIDRSGNAAANRLEAVIARIARRESNTRETRERAQRIWRDILVARRIRGGHVPALMHAWEGLSVD